MEILAALAADPTLLPLWAVLLFAAGMYPVGMMFGCSPCCDPCVCASGSTLPETITVTLDGFTDYSKKQLCTLSFSACYGSGGSGTVDAPGQSSPESDPIDDRGPITAVSLTDGGSGYAKLGRTAPTLSASVYTSTGSGASFDLTVTKAAAPDECGLDYWEVSKIAVVDGGTGYDPSDGVQISLSEGDSADSGAVISVTLAQLPPDLTLGVSSQAGTGAELTPQTKEYSWSTPQDRAWRIQSVTVDDGGDGYTHLDTVTVTRGTGTVFADGFWSDAWLSLVTANTEPTVSASVESTGGTGASLSVTLAETEIYPPPAYSAVSVWAVESIAVDSAGTGYAQFDSISFSVVDGDTRSTAASAYVSEVDANGGILAVFVYSGGEYFKGGPITAVSVVDGGGYVKRNGEIEAVAVTNGGKYYREDASLPPYVATVTVSINQGNNTPSAGTGAVITATVEDDPQSPDFGKITGLTVDDGGDGYLGWVWETNDCCGHYLNGQSIVLERWSDSNAGNSGAFCNAATIPFTPGSQYFSVPVACVYTHRFCGGWKSPFQFLSWPSFFHEPQNRALQLYVGFTGEGQPAVAKLARACGAVSSDDNTATACEQSWISEDNIETCSQFQWSATNENGTSISVASGGAYDQEWRFVGCSETPSASCPSCHSCCQGDDEPPEEIEVSWADEWQAASLPSGQQTIPPRPTTSSGAAAPDTSGTYVFSKSRANEWVFNSTNVGFALGIAPGECGCVGGTLCCEECIRKCTVQLRAAKIYSWAMGQADLFLSDERYEPYGVPRTKHCETCGDTPMCRPPQGLAIPVRSERATSAFFSFAHAGTLTVQ